MNHNNDHIPPVFHIFGATGLIGSSLTAYCIQTGRPFETYSNSGRYGTKVDISSELSVNNIKIPKPNDYIINLAAIAQPAAVYKQQELAKAVNVAGSRNLARLAENSGAKYFFMSSVEVFGGNLACANENTPTSPLNEYGRQKELAEKYILSEHHGKYVIGRTSWNVSSTNTGRCLVKFMIESLQKASPKMATDNIFTIASSRETAENIARAMELDFEGILHIASPSPISRFEIAELIINTYTNRKLKCSPCLFADIMFTEKRSRLNILDTSKSIECIGALYSDPRQIILEKVFELNMHPHVQT